MEQIDILYTRVKTYDGRMMTMPNGNVANSNVDNRTVNKTRRVELTIRVGLDEDAETVKKLIEKTMSAHPGILKHPEPDTWLDEIEEYCLRFTARSWANADDDFWIVYWEQLAAVKKALDERGIKIAVPRRDITYTSSDEKPKT